MIGRGQKTSIEQLRRYFLEWISQTRKKVRDFHKSQIWTGNWKNSAKALNPTEESYCHLLNGCP